ncbi:MAG: NAD-dependent epimerase/dehydratase family protein [Proteobacteria bacterium]|nr:NAD-dependent epimerase/dehydratase family protein [Pseudomonadota bacterium]
MSAGVLLMTGATGFVGRQVLHLLDERLDLHVVSRRPAATDLPARAVLHQIDLTDADTVAELVAKIRPTHLLHLAWTTRHGVFWSDPANVDWLVAGIALLKSFIRHGGRRAVIAGTCAEYAPASKAPCQEVGTLLAPATLYGAMKLALYRASMALAAEHRISFAWPRIFYPYGSGEQEQRLIPSAIAAAKRGECFRVDNPGLALDFMDVRDLGAALQTLLMSSVEGPINLGSGETMSIGAVVALIEELISRHSTRPSDSIRGMLVPDLRRMRSELEFLPRWQLRQGLLDSIALSEHSRGGRIC